MMPGRYVTKSTCMRTLAYQKRLLNKSQLGIVMSTDLIFSKMMMLFMNNNNNTYEPRTWNHLAIKDTTVWYIM